MICSVCQTTLQAAISHFRIAKNQDVGHLFQPISVNGPNGEYIEDHHKTWNDLQDSANQECHICCSIWVWINEELKRTLDILWEKIATGKIPNAYGNAAIQLVLNYRRHQDYQCFTLRFRILKMPETSDRAPAFFPEGFLCECQFVLDLIQGKPYVVPTLETSTWSPRAQRLARNWVGDCVDNHKQCRYSTGDSGWYPTRLLDLGESTEVRLIETKDTKPAGPYTTVTHRWGHVDEDFVLNKQKYLQLIKGIPLDSMPRLFQDTISVARLLGTQYLWIDSLCIFQDKDDKTDWAHEASLMEKVYSYSYCNISAADAENCSWSLFNARDPQSINPETLTLDVVSDEIGGMIPVQFYVYNSDFWDQVSRALVNTRAWVLQERILAPRVLHFGKRQLMWECCERDAAEVFPHGLHPELAASARVRFKSFNLELDHGDQRGYFANSKLPMALALWGRIIFNYTGCDISRSEDKLIACSGVAKRFESLLQDTYVAGMWRTNLETQLFWVKSTRRTGLRPGVYRAPSWSWASMDGTIWLSVWPQDGCLFEIEDVHLSYATPDKTGGITAGWLRLRGVLLQTKLVRVRKHEAAFDLYLEGVRIAAVRIGQCRVSPRVTFDISEGSVDYGSAEDRIFSMVGHAGNERLSMVSLLFKVVDEQRGVFERIGMVRFYVDDQREKVLSIKRELGKPPLPCAEFKDGKHSIIVI